MCNVNEHIAFLKKMRMTPLINTLMSSIQNNPTLKTPYAMNPVKLQARKSKLRPMTLKEDLKINSVTTLGCLRRFL